MGFLYGLWIGPDLVKVYELTVELRFFLRPDLFHCKYPLAEQPPTRLVSCAMILHLLGVPTAAYAKDKTSSGKRVNACHFLCGRNRIALDNQTDARCNPKLRCNRGSCSQGNKWVVSVPIL